MHFTPLSLSLLTLGAWRSAHAAPAPYTTDAPSTDAQGYGITEVATGSLRPGVDAYIPSNSSSNALSYSTANTTALNPAANGDFWEIPGTGLELILELNRKAGLQMNLLRPAFKEWIAEAQANDPMDATLKGIWRKNNVKANAGFFADPGLSQVLTWNDVVLILKNLQAYYTTTQNFVELRYDLDENQSHGDRGRFAKGGIIRLQPTPQ